MYLAYRAALVARLGEPRTAKVLAMDRFNNLIWPNLSVNSRFAVIRQVVPVAVDETIVVAQCFSFDGAPDAMTELSVQFINTAASPASLVASDDLEIFERCQRGLMTQSNDWIDIRRGISTDQRRSDGNVHASGSSELAVRHQLAQWRQWMQA